MQLALDAQATRDLGSALPHLQAAAALQPGEVGLQDHPFAAEVFDQAGQEGVRGEGGGVADEADVPAGPGDGHVQAPLVAAEPHLQFHFTIQ